MVVMVLLVLVIPVSMVTFRMVRSSIKSSTMLAGKRSSIEMANKRIVDYMAQFTNLYASVGTMNLARPPESDGKKHVSSSYTWDATNRTVLIESVGKFGLDPDNPDSQQKVKALIKFESTLSSVGSDMNRINQFRAERDNSIYEGPFVMFNGIINGSNVQFLGGPVIARNTFTNMGMSSIPNPFIDGDLYVGGNLNLKSGSVVTGSTFPFVPEIPEFYLDMEKYNVIRSTVISEYCALWFLGNGSYRMSLKAPGESENSLEYYLKNKGSNFNSGKPIIWSSTMAVPSGGIFLASGVNIGVKGTINPPVTIVSNGDRGTDNAGNIVVIGDILYTTDNGVTISSSAQPSSSLALLSLNRIWLKPIIAQDLTVRGIFYTAAGMKKKGDSPISSMDHFFVVGERLARLYFYGTRNAHFAILGNAFQNGVEHRYDSNLRRYPPPGIPERPLLISYSIE